MAADQSKFEIDSLNTLRSKLVEEKQKKGYKETLHTFKESV